MFFNLSFSHIQSIDKSLFKKHQFYQALKSYNFIINNYNKNIIFKTAMCNFYNKNYILAALYFQKYYAITKLHQAEVGLYNYIYCLYLSSLDYNLDQENTYNAIYGINEFIKKYPNSYKITHIKILLNILLKKLEKKTFQIAQINYNIRNYQAAFLMFKKFLIEYPNSQFIEQALFYALDAHLKFAIHANNEKIKKIRLQEMIIFANQYNLEKLIYNLTQIIKNL